MHRFAPRVRWLPVLGVVAVLPAVAVRAAEAPPAGSIPLPIDKTGTVRAEGKTYYVDGAQVIPRSAEVTVQLGVRIVGINGASLDVQGGLKIHGTQDMWVHLEHVDLSPTRAPFKGLHLDMVDLDQCRWVHGETEGIQGDVTVENSCFQRNCVFDVQAKGGFFKIMTTEFGMPCKLRCAKSPESRLPIEIEVRSSWMKEIAFSGPAVANFMHSEIRGGLECKGVTEVIVDGCDLTQRLAFLQGPDDSFKKVVLTKVNFFDGCKLLLKRDRGPQTKDEKVKLDKPYFGPKGSAAPVLDDDGVGALIEDGADEKDGTVRVWWTKPNKRKHELVNYDTLRTRAPPLR
jgi:hypothetical protein